MDFSKLWKHIGEDASINKSSGQPNGSEAPAGGMSKSKYGIGDFVVLNNGIVVVIDAIEPDGAMMGTDQDGENFEFTDQQIHALSSKAIESKKSMYGLASDLRKIYLGEAIKTTNQYKNIIRKGDKVEGEMTLSSGGTFIGFRASFRLMVIRIAFYDGPDSVAEELWDAQDGMSGLDPDEAGWDWSAIRDSSPDAITQMYKIAQKYVDVADLDAKLKAASVNQTSERRLCEGGLMGPGRPASVGSGTPPCRKCNDYKLQGKCGCNTPAEERMNKLMNEYGFTKEQAEKYIKIHSPNESVNEASIEQAKKIANAALTKYPYLRHEITKAWKTAMYSAGNELDDPRESSFFDDFIATVKKLEARAPSDKHKHHIIRFMEESPRRSSYGNNYGGTLSCRDFKGEKMSRTYLPGHPNEQEIERFAHDHGISKYTVVKDNSSISFPGRDEPEDKWFMSESKVNEQNVDCDMCKTNMSPNNKGCYKYAIDSKGKWTERIPYGGSGEDTSQPCHDCNVKAFGYHHDGCDSEKCSKCGGQFAFCDCDWESLGNKGLKAPAKEAVIVERKVREDHDVGEQVPNDYEKHVGELAGLNANGMKNGEWFEDFMSSWMIRLEDKELIFGWVNGPIGYQLNQLEQNEGGDWVDTGTVVEAGEIEIPNPTAEQEAEFIKTICKKYGKELPVTEVKKILALDPKVRDEECKHETGGHYTGKIPCTGRYACHMCNADLEDPIHGKGTFGNPKVKESKKVNETETENEFEFDTEDGQHFTAEVSVSHQRGEYGADADGRRGEMRTFIDDLNYKIWDANDQEVQSPTAEMIDMVVRYVDEMDLFEKKVIKESDHFTSGKVTQTKDMEDNDIKIGDQVVAMEAMGYVMGQMPEDQVNDGSINTIEEITDDGQNLYFDEHSGRYGSYPIDNFLRLDKYIEQYGQPVEQPPEEREEDEDMQDEDDMVEESNSFDALVSKLNKVSLVKEDAPMNMPVKPVITFDGDTVFYELGDFELDGTVQEFDTGRGAGSGISFEPNQVSDQAYYDENWETIEDEIATAWSTRSIGEKVNEDELTNDPSQAAETNPPPDQPYKQEPPETPADQDQTKQEDPEENKEPSDNANVEDVKEYLGNDGDDMYYSLLSSGEDKDHPTNFQVVDANDQVVYPPKGHSEGQTEENQNAEQFIIAALQALRISNVSYDIVMKYIIPPAEEATEEQGEEEPLKTPQEPDAHEDQHSKAPAEQEKEQAATMPIEAVMNLMNKYKLYENDMVESLIAKYKLTESLEERLSAKYGLLEDDILREANRLLEKYKLYEAPEDEEPKLTPEEDIGDEVEDAEVAAEPTLSPEEDAASDNAEQPDTETPAPEGEKTGDQSADPSTGPTAEPVAGVEPEASTGNAVQPLETPNEAPQTDDPEKLAEFTRKQIMQDYPEEPYTTTALAFADSFVHDPQIYGRIRSLKWQGIYTDSDTFLKQTKIVGDFNNFTPDQSKKLVDKFGESAKYKVSRDGDVYVYITVRDTSKQHSLEAVKDLVNADIVKKTENPGEIMVWWA